MFSPLHSIRRNLIKTHRKALAQSVFKQFDGVIQRGPFKGVKLNGTANISDAAHGLKIFGLYEEPVVERLLGNAGVNTFIDVGAGDGYFPVSLLAKCGFERAIAFEATKKGRAAIAANASLNGVTDRLEVFGAAREGFVADLKGLGIDWSATVILIDIDGGEFDLVNEELLALTRGSRYVIELHDVLGAEAGARENLEARFAAANWKVSVVVDRAREWHDVEEIRGWHDLDRAVLMSEGRKLIGEWLVAEPL